MQELAGVLAGRTFDQLTPADVRNALLADSICWAIVKTSVSTGEPLCDDERFVKIVASSIKTLSRSG